MAQQMLQTEALGIGAPIQAHGHSSEYSIKCSSEISICVKKEEDYSVILQKGRSKMEMTLDEWRSVVANCETMELGYLLLSGNLGRVYK